MGKINFLTGRAMLLPVKSSRIPSDFTVGGGTRGDASFFLSVSTMWSEFGGSVTLLDSALSQPQPGGNLTRRWGGGGTYWKGMTWAVTEIGEKFLINWLVSEE